MIRSTSSFCVTLILSALFALYPPSLVLAQEKASTISQEVSSAMRDLKSANDNLEKVHAILSDLSQGKKVQPNGDAWKFLTEKYTQAASNISAIEVTEVSSAPYAVNISDMSTCKSRMLALPKFEKYVDAQTENIKSITKLDDALQEGLMQAALAEKVLRSTADMNLKLVNTPQYGDIFAWNWFDIENSVLKSLAKARDAMNKQRKIIADEIAKQKKERDNLSSNVAIIKTANCSIDGTWIGSCFINGKAQPFQIGINKPGTSSMCQKISPSTSFPCNSYLFDANNNNIAFGYTAIWDGGRSRQAITLSGSVSNNYDQMSLAINGTPIQNGDSPWSGRCTLHK